MNDGPTPADIAAARESLRNRIVETPVLTLSHDRFPNKLPRDSHVAIKLELFQEAGSFKARGALLSMDALDDACRARGVVTASAGNHARAVAWAAGKSGVSARIVMPRTADPMRVAACEALGARVDLVPTVMTVFSRMEEIAEADGRTIVHPFEGPSLTLGTATCGAEFVEAAGPLDIAVIPVGGGGLISGMSRAIKLAAPGCMVIGVEPEGADAMGRSFASGVTERLPEVATIADSLGAPMTLPYSLGIARQNVDRMVTVSDDALRDAMRLMLECAHLMVEPACVATLAAITGPLRDVCAGKRVGIIACGSNMSQARFASLVAS